MNLLDFGDIIKGGVKDYPDMAKKEYMPSVGQSATPTHLHDLAVQTAIQASIAHRKFKFFHSAGTLVLLAFVCMGFRQSFLLLAG